MPPGGPVCNVTKSFANKLSQWITFKLKATLENLKPSETIDASVTISGPNLITPEKMVYYSDYQILYTLHNLHFLVCIGATALSSTLF